MNTAPELTLVPRDPRDAADEGIAVAEPQLERLVTAACLAPSGGNAQPWRWVWRNRSLWLFIDRRHSRALLDFRSLASIAALGAASENLVLAAHAEGLGVHVSPFPLPAEPSCVARFRFCLHGGPRDEPNTADHLVSVIGARVTNRHRETRASLPEDIFAAMGSTVRVEWVGSRSADVPVDHRTRTVGAQRAVSGSRGVARGVTPADEKSQTSFCRMNGQKHVSAKPLKGLGSGVQEVVSDHRGDTFSFGVYRSVGQPGFCAARVPEEVEEWSCDAEARRGSNLAATWRSS